MNTVVISDSPHIRSNRTTKNIMLDVVIALLPACIVGCVYFGLKALLVLALSVVGAVCAEVVYKLCQKKRCKQILQEFDFTSLITGMLVGMCMSSEVKWYVPLISSIFAIVVVKMIFGGTGKNIVNPAIVGRVFAFISFVAVGGMATYSYPTIFSDAGIISGATTLTDILSGGITSFDAKTLLNYFLGVNLAGTIGETCKLALLVGGIYLIVRKVIDYKWPLLYIVSCGLMSTILYGSFAYFMPSILTGGLFLGAIFMATDYVTSPNNKYASIAYYICLGILTAILRKATHMEVVSFAILIMNLLVPLFNKALHPRPFGSEPIKDIIAKKCAAIFKKKEKEAK